MTAADERAAAERAQRARTSRMAGLAAAAKMTPEERVARARKAGLASAAARRAKIEAEGRTVPEQGYKTRANPTEEELSEFLEEAYRKHPTLSYTAQRRQAVILRRQYLARLAFEQGKPAPEDEA